MKKLIVLLAACLPFVNMVSQEVTVDKADSKVETMTKFGFQYDDCNGDSIPPVVYDHMTVPPEFLGGVGALDDFITENLKYPAEAWNDTSYTSKNLRNAMCVIRTDGRAIIVPDEKRHPALHKEMSRVMALMPTCKPAELDGKIVDVVFRIQTDLLDPYFRIPLSAMPLIKEARAIAKDVDRRYDGGMDKEYAESVASKLFAIHKEGWDELDYSLIGARLLASLGKYDDAADMLESELLRYHNLGFWGDERLSVVTPEMYYQPTKELDATLTLAAIRDMAGQKDAARRLYDRAMWLTSIFIVEGIGHGRTEMQRMQYYNDLMQEKAYIVRNSSSASINLNPSERYDIERERVLGYVNREIDKQVDAGKISHARIVQINGLMDNMNFDHSNKKTISDAERLYKLRVMIVGLRDGQEAQKEYIAQVESGTEAGNKIGKRIGAWSKEANLPALEDRRHLLESIVLFAPLNVDGTRDEAAREASKTFYERRKELEKVYPLKWLR